MRFLLIIYLFIINLFCVNAQSTRICTTAGDGVAGYNGDSTQSDVTSLNNPAGIAMDSNGNLYVADYSNHRIRKITNNGIITTVAGTGVAGFSGDGGLATSAQLNFPISVAVDHLGNLYVSDYSNNRIRKVTTDNIITTIAGGGAGGDNVLAINAQISNPNGIDFDQQGNIYFAERGRNKIRKIDLNGIITTFAGTGVGGFLGDGGSATAARLNWPNGVVLDNIGNLYFTDQSNNRIRKIDTNGIINTFAGGGSNGLGDGGQATSAQLNQPNGIIIDNQGNIVFTDYQNQRVRKIDSNGIITTIAGTGTSGFSGDGGNSLQAQLGGPNGICYDSFDGYYISEYSNNRIRKVYSPIQITLESAVDTDTQTVCLNSAIDNVIYTVNNISTPTINGLPNGVISSVNSNTVVISGIPTTLGLYTYTVSFRQIGNCDSSFRIGKIDVVPINLINTSLPETICMGNSTTITASGASNYSWSPSTGLNAITGATVVATPSVTTTYSVTDVGSCPNNIQEITITVNSLPASNITPSKIQQAASSYPTIVFTGSNGLPPYTFHYTVNDGPVQSISTQSDKDTVSLLVPFNTPTTLIYKTISVEDANGCSQNQTDSIVFKVNPPLAIEDLSKQQMITVFPNPVQSLLNVNVYSPASVAIKDITGREVYAGNINAGTSVVNVSHLSSGIYFVVIKNNTGVTTHKIIKQ